MGQTASRAHLQIGTLLGLALLISLVRSHWGVLAAALAFGAANLVDALFLRKVTTPVPVVTYVICMVFVAAVAWYF